MQPPDDAGASPKTRAGQLILELGHTPSLIEADFIVSEGNRFAFDHVCAFPHWSGPLTLVTGPTKSGKSHLARIWVERAEAEVVMHDALERYAGAGGQTPLLLEDVDRVPYDEAAMFHLLNQSMRDVRPLMLTARKPVAEWGYVTNDVMSRARLAAHFPVQMPDDTQLSQMFAKLFADRQIEVDVKIVTYLTTRMERSAAEVAALVALMDELAMARGRPIGRVIAAEALELRMRARERADGVMDDEREE